MQDRYAGDIGDYGKFAMLRALASRGLAVGVNWYRIETPPQELSINDGGKLIPDRLFPCDPELAHALRAISLSPERSVRELEEAELIPGASYYSVTTPVEERRKWHDDALSELAKAEVVFLDPDNGLLVKSVGRGSARSPKYTFYDEVADYVARGQSVIVYNHRSRQKPEAYFDEKLKGLVAAAPQADGITVITFPKGSVRDYFAIGATPAYAAMIQDVFDGLVKGPWGKAGMCRLQPLPL